MKNTVRVRDKKENREKKVVEGIEERKNTKDTKESKQLNDILKAHEVFISSVGDRTGIESSETPIRVALSVPLMATYLSRGLKQHEIAKICNVSDQSVSCFIQRNSNSLLPLIDGTDGLLSFKVKHTANLALDKLSGVMETADRRDIMPLNMVAGTMLDKHRLFSNQSTENIGISGVISHLHHNLFPKDKEKK